MGTPVRPDARREAWERWAEWPLMVVAVSFLVAYAWPILNPDLEARWHLVLATATWVAWAVFAVDYAARLVLTDRRWRFVRRNLLDLAVIVLPLLRPLRLLRLVTLVRILNRQTSAARGRPDAGRHRAARHRDGNARPLVRRAGAAFGRDDPIRGRAPRCRGGAVAGKPRGLRCLSAKRRRHRTSPRRTPFDSW